MRGLILKTMAPGCNCCGRALIWDALFDDWEGSKEWLEEAGANVDFAFGPDRTNRGTASGFDPHTDGVDLGYWTGSIHDYRLVIWPDTRDTIAGGEPQWVEDVMTGSWSGRIVLTYEGVSGFGHSRIDYVNTFSDRTGIQINTDKQSRHGERLAGCTAEYLNVLGDRFDRASCTYIDFPWTADPLPGVILETDAGLLDGVSTMYNGPPSGMRIDHGVDGIAGAANSRAVTGNRTDFSVESTPIAAGVASGFELLFSTDSFVSDFASSASFTEEKIDDLQCDSGDLAGFTNSKIVRTYLMQATAEGTIHTGGQRSVRKESGALVEFVIIHRTYPMAIVDRDWDHPALRLYAEVCDDTTLFFDVIEDITADPTLAPYRESHRQFVINLWEKGLLPVP